MRHQEKYSHRLYFTCDGPDIDRICDANFRSSRIKESWSIANHKILVFDRAEPVGIEVTDSKSWPTGAKGFFTPKRAEPMLKVSLRWAINR